MSLKTLIDKLKNVQALLGAMPLLLPAGAFFADYSPPLFVPIWLITTAVSAYILYLGYEKKPRGKKRLIQKPIFYLILAFVMAIAYVILMDMTTAYIGSNKEYLRYQVGWSTEDWSLREEGRELKRAPQCRSATPSELLSCAGASQGNVRAIWKPVYIYVFGLLNMAVFCTIFFSWAYGWGMIVRKMAKEPTVRKPTDSDDRKGLSN